MHRLFQNVALALVSVLLLLGISEALLRVVLPLRVSPEVEYYPDGHLAFRLTPDRVYRLPSGDTCTINGLGFRRTGEIELPKPAGTYRIVALGGSSTFAYLVGDEDTWVRRLEMHLGEDLAATGRRIEVINAGAPGYSSFDSKINYFYRIRSLEPDAILVYHTWNDLKRFRVLEQEGYFLRRGFQSQALESLLKNFQIAWRARQLYQTYVLKPRREDFYPTLAAFNQPIPRDGRAHRWEAQNFTDLAAWARSDGALPIFVTQGGLLSAANLHDEEIRRHVEVDYVRMTHEIVLEQWEITSNLIREVARKDGAVLVDARPRIPASLEYFVDAVHLNRAGNAALARVIADSLLADPRFLEQVGMADDGT